MTKIFAHRGSKGTHPENTLPAFQEAINVEADGIELDVQLTKDGYLVVIHDEQVDRTTDGTGWVKDFLLSDLKLLDAGTWFSEEYKGTQIPTLEEVINLLIENDFSGMLNIELKTDEIEYPLIEEKLLDTLNHKNMPFSVILSSFNKSTMQRIEKLDTQYEKAFIAYGNDEDVRWVSKQEIITSFHPDIRWLKNHMDVAKKISVIRPWTVNQEQDMKVCFEQQLSGIFTDFPKKAIEVRENG